MCYNASMNLAHIKSACTKAKISDWPLRGRGWNHFMIIRKAFKPADVTSAVWCDYRGQNPTLWGPPDMWKESTFDQCVVWEYNVETRELTVWMRNGDMLDGRPNDLRCKWTFIVDEYATTLVDELLTPEAMRSLGHAASAAYEKAEAARVSKAVARIMATYLES